MIQRPTLLVVEDDGMVRSTIRDVLADDYSVTGAATAGMALLALAGKRFDVVLLDHHMPDGSSEIIAEGFKEAGVPTVWMTGDLNAPEALAAGPGVVLTKPFSTQQMLKALAVARGF